MGLPIRGIVAHVSTATDKQGRSVPAPGQGILTTARERPHADGDSPLLSVQYRRQFLEADLDEARSWRDRTLKLTGSSPLEADQVSRMYARKCQAAYALWGQDFYLNNPRIAPLRGALAVYGLSIDDLGVASSHGTGTEKNDFNESQVLQKQLVHLGRSPGNVILNIFQKYLTGHPKGAAAAWMLNGLLQVLNSGVVPGNRNADNIDPELRQFDHIAFLDRSLHTYGIKAGLLKSFGFGQVGGEVLVVHANYVLASLDPNAYAKYVSRRHARENEAYRHYQQALCGKRPFVTVKTHAPFDEKTESGVYLDPMARASYDEEAGTWLHAGTQLASSGPLPSPQLLRRSTASDKSKKDVAAPSERAQGDVIRRVRRLSPSAMITLEIALREMNEGLRGGAGSQRGVGIDCQLVSEIDVSLQSAAFVERNFTEAEIAYCRSAPDPSSSFAGRWAAKEAVVKALSSCDSSGSSLWEGGHAPLRDIEVLRQKGAAPVVKLSGHAEAVAKALGVTTVKVSISHSGDYAVAQAVAN